MAKLFVNMKYSRAATPTDLIHMEVFVIFGKYPYSRVKNRFFATL